MSSTMPASITSRSLGFVIIGRNEGERLLRCLQSVRGAGPVVYVDSGSTDASAAGAQELGARVVELDLSQPFTAARARNAGFEKLVGENADIALVHFIDGDCEIVPGWLEHAINVMNARPDVAALSGRIRERDPGASIYNRLADREWDAPVGEVASCAGVSVMRADALRQVNGFDPSIPAGEEPELCSRLRAAGFKILRVGETMCLHDMAMHSFSQWWRRNVRGGYGAMDVATRFDLQNFRRQVRSARTWAIGWPLLLLASIASGFVLPWLLGVLLILLVLVLPLIQAARIARAAYARGAEPDVAAMHGLLTIVGKFAAIAGQWKFKRDQKAGAGARLIEHKTIQSRSDLPASPRLS